VASRPALAVRPDASSLPASKVLAAGAVVAVPRGAFPQEEECAGAATARLAEEFATAEQARADCSAALRTDGSIQADLVLGGWARADCSAEQSADGSVPAGYSGQAGRGERRCSLDALPAYWAVAELRHD